MARAVLWPCRRAQAVTLPRVRRDARGCSIPQDAPNDDHQRRGGPSGARGGLRQAGAVAAVCGAASTAAANSYDQVDALVARRLLAIAARCDRRCRCGGSTRTLTRGGFTARRSASSSSAGAKTDIVTPTDRFAPRDFLNVIDTEFLARARRAARVSARARTSSRPSWVPYFTPSRVPLLDQRWTRAAARCSRSIDAGASIPERLAGGRALGRTGAGYEHVAVVLRRLQPPAERRQPTAPPSRHRSRAQPEPLPDGRLDIPVLTPVSADPIVRRSTLAVPTRWFTRQGRSRPTSRSPTPATDEYVLYVVQVERQIGRVAARRRLRRRGGDRASGRVSAFAPDRGLSALARRPGVVHDRHESIAGRRERGQAELATASTSRASTRRPAASTGGRRSPASSSAASPTTSSGSIGGTRTSSLALRYSF